MTDVKDGVGMENKVSNGYHRRQYTGEDICIEPWGRGVSMGVADVSFLMTTVTMYYKFNG